jgi:hypothetical protein
LTKGFTPFLGVKGFVIMVEVQVRDRFSTSFRDREGFDIPAGSKAFVIMAGTSAGCGWGWWGNACTQTLGIRQPWTPFGLPGMTSRRENRQGDRPGSAA